MALDKTPDMESLTPAERAALYKQRAAAAGIGRGASPASAGGATPAPTAPPATPAEPAEAAPPVAAAPPPPVAQPAPSTAPAAEKPAAPPAPKEPEKPKVPQFVQQVLDTVPGSSWEWRHGYAEMRVPREWLLDAAHTLYAEGLDYLSFITEVDWKDRFELLYHLYSYDYERQPLGAILRTDLPREEMPEIASVTPVWPGAEYMERECYEMMGIRFLGHPDLRKLLLPEDFVGFPMRRDYETDFAYVTVKHLALELDPTYRIKD